MNIIAGIALCCSLFAPQQDSLFGTITAVNYVRENARDPMVEIRFDNQGKNLTVEIAPSSFLKEYGFDLKPGDDVSIRLRRETSGNKLTLVAKEIRQGSRALTLRDENGKPLW